MVDLIVAGLSNYSWVFVCLFIVGWALVRWAHYRLNRATLKPRFNPNKKRSISKKFDFYLRYFKRAITGRNYKKTSDKLDIYLFLGFVGSIVLVPIGLFLNGTLSWSISRDPMEWGVIGDFFGGTLNPILAFASFIALLYTIRIQSEELRLTREEFAKSVKAQERMASESESQLSRQVLLDDYRYVVSKVRSDSLDLHELVRQPIDLKQFPAQCYPPLNIGELIYGLTLHFYDRTNKSVNDANACFERARNMFFEASVDKGEPQTVLNGISYENRVELFELHLKKHLDKFLNKSLKLFTAIEYQTELCRHVSVTDAQAKVREDDARNAMVLVVYAYVMCRTLRFGLKYHPNMFVPKESGRLADFEEILGNLSLPSEALATLYK